MSTSLVMLVAGMICTLFAGAKYVGLCTLKKPKENQELLVRNAFIMLCFFVFVTGVSCAYVAFDLFDNPGTKGLRFLGSVMFALVVSYLANSYYKNLIKEKKEAQKDSE